MEVVEHEHERLRRRKPFEQRAHGTVAPVALVLQSHLTLGRECGQRREDVCELRSDVVVESLQAAPFDSAQVLVESIHEDRKRQVALELRRRSGEDEVSPVIRASSELGQETRLSDAGLSDELDRCRDPLIELVQDSIKRVDLRRTTYEKGGMQGHFAFGPG